MTKYMCTALVGSVCMLLSPGGALAGEMQPLESPPDRSTEAWWINEGGTIAGTAYGPNGAVPLRWVEGELEVLDGPLVMSDGEECEIIYGDSRMVDNEGLSVAVTVAFCASRGVVFRASWWDEDGVWRPFPMPPSATETYIPYVNDDGDVAMGSDAGLFVLSEGAFKPLPPLHDDDADCGIFAMNNPGVVTGSCTGSDGVQRAVAWIDGVAHELRGSAGNGATNYGRAINDRGDIVGFSGWAEDDPRRLPGAAVLWPARDGGDGEVVHDPGAANAINNRGMIAGFTGVNGDADTRATVWWPGGEVEDLGTLGGPFSIARSINERGVVVGSSLTTDGRLVGFTYDTGIRRAP